MYVIVAALLIWYRLLTPILGLSRYRLRVSGVRRESRDVVSERKRRTAVQRKQPRVAADVDVAADRDPVLSAKPDRQLDYGARPKRRECTSRTHREGFVDHIAPKTVARHDELAEGPAREETARRDGRMRRPYDAVV